MRRDNNDFGQKYLAQSTYKFDCRQFCSDRPCKPHKLSGKTCPTCNEYDPVAQRILIVKLDAAGDVLRTTALLRPLKAQYPNSKVTWITKKESVDLLRNLKEVDEIVAKDSELPIRLGTEIFDLVLNPDAALDSARIATFAQAKEKRGFLINDDGRVFPTNEMAAKWFETGLDDRKKKSNDKTYQQWLLHALEIPALDHPILWSVSETEKTAAQKKLSEKLGSKLDDFVFVGLNTGAGGRWKYKKWTLEGYTQLIKKLTDHNPKVRIVLYGGEAEDERNQTLAQVVPHKTVDTGTANTLREFGALVDLCDVMVTGDTMALHLASALNRPVIALFGPTSHAEIEIYGRGEKLFAADMPCLVCYLNDCNVRPTCMDKISVDRVFQSVVKHLELKNC